jgi:hypothetical protein
LASETKKKVASARYSGGRTVKDYNSKLSCSVVASSLLLILSMRLLKMMHGDIHIQG